MNAVEFLGLRGGPLDTALRNDPQPGILPVRLRRVASGLMIENVRSVAMARES
jgi:hypothetical protein